jgi:hypothetical protein
MKPIAYTAHAEENLVARSIRREDVEQAGCILVITLYKTSKIGKYLNRTTP